MVMCMPEISATLRQHMKEIHKQPSEKNTKWQIKNLKVCLDTFEGKEKRLAIREENWHTEVMKWRQIYKNHPGTG